MRITLFILLLASIAQAQEFKYITIDTTWDRTIIDQDNLGDENCIHQWIYGPIEKRATHETPTTNHPEKHPPGKHCLNEDPYRERICSLCLRHETQKGTVNQKKVITFESLKEKLK